MALPCRRLAFSLGWLPAAAAAILCAQIAPGRASSKVVSNPPNIEQLATGGLTDFEAKVRVVEADQEALAKINRDFGMAYRLKELTMRYKDPNKLRMDGTIGQLVVNGSQRWFRVPAIHLNKHDDLGDSPGKRYSLIDIGVLARSALHDMDCRYLRDERLDGAATFVFQLGYRGELSDRNRIWLDERTHLIDKREWLDNTGKVRATFLYQQPKEVQPGLWFPTRVEILNGENAVAAITSYDDLKVNQGLSDALFDIS